MRRARALCIKVVLVVGLGGVVLLDFFFFFRCLPSVAAALAFAFTLQRPRSQPRNNHARCSIVSRQEVDKSSIISVTTPLSVCITLRALTGLVLNLRKGFPIGGTGVAKEISSPFPSG